MLARQLTGDGSAAVHGFVRPRRREWMLLAPVALAIVIYLPIVVHRTVTLGLGDVQVFFRAGWAVWTGYPLYEVADHHGWTYHYPPTFALFMGPFANALPGFPQPGWALPYPLAVAVWYGISAAALLAALHVWARAIAHATPLPARGYWCPWWLLRVGPLLALLPFAGDGLGRGQPTAVLLLCMVGFLALYMAGRKHAASVLLALGIAIKMFPAALAFIPLLRRDWRTLALTALWSFALLFVLPLVCLGPQATAALYETLWRERLAGILGGVPSSRIATEITFWSYDNVSIGAMLARIRAGRMMSEHLPLPAWASAAQLVANLAFVAALGVIGHGRFWRWRGTQPAREYSLLIAGALIMAALPAMLSVSQPHYWTFGIPLFAVLLVETWRRAGVTVVSPVLVAYALLAWAGMILIEVREAEGLRLIGLTTPVMLALVIWGFAALARTPRASA